MNRYSRQLLYKNIGAAGQSLFKKAKVSIIGVGALGTVCAELLARAGIGTIFLVDRDYVELGNLQRQTLFDESDIGKPKASAASAKLSIINSEIKINYLISDIDYKNINLIGKPDLILACTDNMESRFLVNDYCRQKKIAWIYGAAISDRGSVYDVMPNGPCIRCLFKGSSGETCDTSGILNTASTITAGIMSNEALKIILGKPHEDKLLMMDFWGNDYSKIKVKKKTKCMSCNGKYEYLSGKIRSSAVKLCGTGSYQIKGSPVDIIKLSGRLKSVGKVILLNGIMHFDDITLFSDGRAIIRAESEKDAKKKYAGLFG